MIIIIDNNNNNLMRWNMITWNEKGSTAIWFVPLQNKLFKFGISHPWFFHLVYPNWKITLAFGAWPFKKKKKYIKQEKHVKQFRIGFPLF